MQCPQYQYENASDARFCDECGTPLAGPCSVCGMENRPGAKFCKGCGISLTVHTSAASRDLYLQAQKDAKALLDALAY